MFLFILLNAIISKITNRMTDFSEGKSFWINSFSGSYSGVPNKFLFFCEFKRILQTALTPKSTNNFDLIFFVLGFIEPFIFGRFH